MTANGSQQVGQKPWNDAALLRDDGLSCYELTGL
jgi:hypothetical protein